MIEEVAAVGVPGGGGDALVSEEFFVGGTGFGNAVGVEEE